MRETDAFLQEVTSMKKLVLKAIDLLFTKTHFS